MLCLEAPSGTNVQVRARTWVHPTRAPIEAMAPALAPPQALGLKQAPAAPVLYVAAGAEEVGLWDIGQGRCCQVCAVGGGVGWGWGCWEDACLEVRGVLLMAPLVRCVSTCHFSDDSSALIELHGAAKRICGSILGMTARSATTADTW